MCIHESKYGHVAYQIEGNEACSGMVVNIFSQKHTRHWSGFKKTFFKVVVLHIKLLGMEHRSPRRQILCHSTPSIPVWGENIKYFSFLKMAMLHIKL